MTKGAAGRRSSFRPFRCVWLRSLIPGHPGHLFLIMYEVGVGDERRLCRRRRKCRKLVLSMSQDLNS